MRGELLALEHDDVFVVLVDLPVCVGSPQFLDLVCRPFSLLLHVEDVLHYKIIIQGCPIQDQNPKWDSKGLISEMGVPLH